MGCEPGRGQLPIADRDHDFNYTVRVRLGLWCNGDKDTLLIYATWHSRRHRIAPWLRPIRCRPPEAVSYPDASLVHCSFVLGLVSRQ